MSYLASLISASGTVRFYGDGSDGNVTISANTTLTRDMYYNNLTVNTAAVVSTAGYRVFVAGTLTLNNGTIENTCPAGGTPTAGAAPGANFFGVTANGPGAGGTGPQNGFSAGAATNALGGNGGAGGASGAGNAGGLTTAAIVPVAIAGGVRCCDNPVGMAFGRQAAFVLVQEGCSAGGGGAAAASTGGGGGYGGGYTFVAAKNIVDGGGGGSIRANGGNGGPASGANAGGGGGGGGGFVGVITDTNPLPGGVTLNVAGGTGGAAVGTGVVGSAGLVGRSVTLFNT